MAQFRRPAAQHRDERAITGRGPEEVRERVATLRELHHLHAGLLEENPALEDVHRRGVEPRTDIEEAAAALVAALDQSRGTLRGEQRGVQVIIVKQQADHAGPLERGQRNVHRASRDIVERQESRRLSGTDDEMAEGFGAIAEGPDDDRFSGGHIREYSGPAGGGLLTNAGSAVDFGPHGIGSTLSEPMFVTLQPPGQKTTGRLCCFLASGSQGCPTESPDSPNRSR